MQQLSAVLRYDAHLRLVQAHHAEPDPAFRESRPLLDVRTRKWRTSSCVPRTAATRSGTR